MPGPGTAVGPAAVRLREGLDGWRRHIARRRSAAAARRWSLITLGAALAGVAAGRLDGTMLVAAVAATALPLGAGAVSVVRARRVSAADAARHLDAAFGFDEQVATALCCAEAGTAVSGPTSDRNRLVAELIERATGLVAHANVVAEPRPVPAYGEWAAMAVTAAAIAAAATVPGSAQVASATGAGGPVRARPSAAAAVAPRPSHARGAMPGNAGSPDAGVTSRHGSATAARTASAGGTQPTGEARPAASPAGGTNAQATGSAPALSAKAGPQSSAGKAGPRAGGGPSVAAPAGSSGQRGHVRPGGGPAPAMPGTGAQRTGARPATARHAAGQRGTAARGGGLPGGNAAGKEPGGNPDGGARKAQPLPSAGDTVLLIVLSSGAGTVAAPAGQGAPGQPAGDGAAATAVPAATAQGNSAGYVPPDQNEVPFPDLGVLGRYF